MCGVGVTVNVLAQVCAHPWVCAGPAGYANSSLLGWGNTHAVAL